MVKRAVPAGPTRAEKAFTLSETNIPFLRKQLPKTTSIMTVADERTRLRELIRFRVFAYQLHFGPEAIGKMALACSDRDAGMQWQRDPDK
jgi:hypothetical protein